MGTWTDATIRKGSMAMGILSMLTRAMVVKILSAVMTCPVPVYMYVANMTRDTCCYVTITPPVMAALLLSCLTRLLYLTRVTPNQRSSSRSLGSQQTKQDSPHDYHNKNNNNNTG